MRGSLRIGRIAGFPVGIHWSLVVLGPLVASFFASSLIARDDGVSPVLAWLFGALVVVLLFASVLAHELAHAVVARRSGIGVAGVDLWALGGIARFKGEAPTPRAEFLVSGAGPLASAVVGVGALGGSVLAEALSEGLLAEALGWVGVANLVLAVFNVLPAAPLDGGRMLQAVLWWRSGDRHRAGEIAARAGRMLGAAVLGVAVWQLLSGRLSPFLLLLGWFLLVNARGEEYVHRVRGALGTLRVGEVMSPVPPAVPDHLTVQEVLDDSWRFAGRDLLGVRRFDGTVSGLVSLDRLRRIPASDRHRVRIAEVAVDLEHLGNAVAAEPVTEVLGRMTPQLPVIAVWGPGWRLDGLLTADDVRRAMDRGTAAGRRAPLPA